MPDHFHALVEGCCESSDTVRFAAHFRQRSGYQFRQQHAERLWQEGYYDRILRDTDDTFKVARYIIANPVRAGLCVDAGQYAYSGSSRYTLLEILGSLG